MNDLLQKIQLYLLDTGIKRLGPAALGAAVSALLALMAAHQGLLETWGITFGTWPLAWTPGQAPSGHVILIELDTLSQTALVALTGLAGAFYAAIAHHTGNLLSPPKAQGQ